MASAVATPLETQLAGVPGVIEMTSSSMLGSTSISLQFSLESNMDSAGIAVQAALNAAVPHLPKTLANLPSWRQVAPSDIPVVDFLIQSDRMTLPALSDVAETLLARPLAQLPGVAQVFINGLQRPAVRIEVAPEKLAAYELTLEDLRQTLLRASVNGPKGILFGNSYTATIATDDQLVSPEEYGRLVVAYRSGRPIQLSEVARPTASTDDRYVAAWQDGRRGLQLGIFRQPGANVVEVANAVERALPALVSQLPAGIHVEKIEDRTRTIRGSLIDVAVALAATIVLAMLVSGIFLRQLVAVFVVAAALTISLLGTLALMRPLGFSLNTLTLMALVLSVGFIVDDCIVVLENIQRHLEEGNDRLAATVKGSDQVSRTVIAISVALVAAFTPLLFMGGIIGRVFREFAVTLSAAVLISALVSTTLVPVMAARWLRTLKPNSSFGDGIGRYYEAALRKCMAHPGLVLGVFCLLLAGSIALYARMPNGFFPRQDTGFVSAITQAAADISFPDMLQKQQRVAQIIAGDPAVEHYASVIGDEEGTLSQGQLFISLKEHRSAANSAAAFIDRVQPQLAAVPGIQTFLRAAQDISLTAFGVRSEYFFTLRCSDAHVLYSYVPTLIAALERRAELREVSSDLQLGARVASIRIDRSAAARHGVSTDDIDQTLYDAFGQRQIIEYQTQTNTRHVILVVNDTLDPTSAMPFLYVRSSTSDTLVPLLSVVNVEPPDIGAVAVTHSAGMPAVNVSFNTAPGVSLGAALKAIVETERSSGVPAGVTSAFTGSAGAFEQTLSTMPWLILAAIVALYCTLGFLYESIAHPFTIISTIPAAGLGAALALLALSMDLSISALIGLILLIGIVVKNGVMLVDFAIDGQRRLSLSPEGAIERACVLRFRPILMTTIAAMLGSLPFALGYGIGAEVRQPVGIVVLGGLALSQLLTMGTTPVVYLWVQRAARRLGLNS